MNLNKPTYITAVKSLVDGNIGGYNDGPIEKIKFFDGQTPPSEEQIQAKIAELQAEYDSKQYQRDRFLEYPSIQDCIHALLEGGDTLTELQAKRIAIKEKFPKPE